MAEPHEYGQLFLDHLESAWIVIANAGQGNWSTQTPEWQEAATRWRDKYHEYLADWEGQM